MLTKNAYTSLGPLNSGLSYMKEILSSLSCGYLVWQGGGAYLQPNKTNAINNRYGTT